MNVLKKIGNFILDIIESFVMALAMFVLMYLFLFQPHQVKGNSMYPNFHDKEYLLTDKITYRFDEPKRGDVIIFKAPKNEEYDYIKRIIGLPGELVRIENCHVYINDKLLKEDYLSSEVCTTGGRFWQTGQNIPVPPEQFFVLGDNRPHSSDSRDWGPVPKQNIIGKARFRYWPAERIGLIEKINY